MFKLWLIASTLQAGLILADEVLFHRRRGLPRWERMGHPLDTLTMIVCVGFVLSAAPGDGRSGTFLALAIVSSLFVTKDEWVHAVHCSAGEQWLHALLFILHPLVLTGLWFVWPEIHSGAKNPAGLLAWAQAGFMSLFMGYQLVYWSLRARREGSR